MKLKLYILVDKAGRLLYTESNRKQLKEIKKAFQNNNNLKNLKIVKLTGEIK